MKTYLSTAVLIWVFLLFFINACTTVQTIYLQNIEVSGPILTTPIHITDSSKTPSITISPKFSFNTQKSINGLVEGHTKTNQYGMFQVDSIVNGDGTITYRRDAAANRYNYDGANLIWNFAAVNAGLDIDLKFSKSVSIFTGVNYSSQRGKTTMGGNAGIGLSGYSEGLAFRLDLGMNIQTISYDAETVVEVKTNTIFGGESEYVLFYRDIGKSTHFDPFINFTFNTAKRQWLINFFINAGYTIQSIVDFEPRTPNPFYYPLLPLFPYSQVIIQDLRGESTAGFFSVTPGIYFNFGKTNRIILGTGIYFETQIRKPSETIFILPMIKVDLTL